MQLRILTYNIHEGEGTDGKFDLERIAEVIKRAEPDLVAVQEVDRNTRRSGRVDQPAVLGELTGMHHFFAIAMPYDDGEYGELVLSRHPFLTRNSYILPSGPNVEPRGLAEVRIEFSLSVRVKFVATHLEHEDEQERLKQARFINDLYASDATTPTILAGDLNAMPESELAREMTSHWLDSSEGKGAPTFPSPTPTRKIDYVLFKPGAAFKVLETQVIDERIASDHRPFLAVLELAP